MTRREIEAIAESIAKIYNSESLAPFPYENIVDDKKDLNISFLDLEDNKITGVILYDDIKKYNILINTNQHEHQQHLTLGHELGHYFLHSNILSKKGGIIGFIDTDSITNNTPSQDNSENEASYFAYSLIMPIHLVEKAWNTLHDIEECARIFNVSVIAMSVRLTELGLIS